MRAWTDIAGGTFLGVAGYVMLESEWHWTRMFPSSTLQARLQNHALAQGVVSLEMHTNVCRDFHPDSA